MKRFYTLLCASFPIWAVAQHNTVASGGEALGSGGSSSFSVGQIAYHRPAGDGFSSLEGLQQPIEVTVLQNPEFEINPQLRIYPNPVYSGFYISLAQQDYPNLKYTLTDLNGKVVRKDNITAAETFVNMEAVTPGVYILQLQGAQNTNGYKIIKR